MTTKILIYCKRIVDVQVDAHVGKHLFEECLRRYLSGRTRILATHQLQYLKKADCIVLLDQGKIHQYADYHELLSAYPEYGCLLAEEKPGDKSEDSSVEKSRMRRQFSSSSTRVSSTRKNILRLLRFYFHQIFPTIYHNMHPIIL